MSKERYFGSKKIEQVEDDPVLFEKILEDTANADPLYRPTNYWEVYSKSFVPDLKKWASVIFEAGKIAYWRPLIALTYFRGQSSA